MKNEVRNSTGKARRSLRAVALLSAVVLGTSVGARADDADAKRLLKAMSDNLTVQTAFSADYDANLEVVTKGGQILALASSGAVTVKRPEQIRVTRTGGFADVVLSFDGKTLTLLGKNLNLYTQLDLPGTLDHLVEELRVKHNRPLPAADLLLPNPYDELMRDVVDVKDLGSGVIRGVECDHLAFRKPDVDWQIWITQGENPVPCRYVISSKGISGGPQYTVDFRNWKTGSAVATTDFGFNNTTNAGKVDMQALNKDAGDLPAHFVIEEKK